MNGKTFVMEFRSKGLFLYPLGMYFGNRNFLQELRVSGRVDCEYRLDLTGTHGKGEQYE